MKKILYSAIPLIIITLILLVVYVMRGNSSEDSSNLQIGKYVYIDESRCIHTDKDCVSKLQDGFNSREAQMLKLQGVEFVDTSKLYLYRGFNMCPRCVSDEQYSKINALMGDRRAY